MIDPTNPYASPTVADQATTDHPEWDQPLATRGRRLLGAIIDGLILFVVFTVPYMLILPQIYPQMAEARQPKPGVTFWEAYQAAQPPLLIQITASLIGIGVFLLLHGYLLATNGQTIGKRVLGMKIVRSDGTPAEFGHLIGLRYLPMWILAFTPVVGGLIAGLLDPLLIFRSSRQCLHDSIADTIVVRA